MKESFFEKPKQPEQPKQPEKKEEGLLFEVKKRLGKFDVSIGIERGEEPVKAEIDFIKNKIEGRITPEGIREGVKVIKNFLDSPGANKMENLEERLRTFNNKWEKWLDEKKKQKSQDLIKEYAEQEGKDEAEIVKEFLDEIEKNNLEK